VGEEVGDKAVKRISEKPPQAAISEVNTKQHEATTT